MTTLVAGAPLLAGGPPGWVAYGLLAIVTIGGAYVISQSMSNAEEEADKKLETGTATDACSTCGDNDPCSGLRKQLAAHRKKLEDYKNDPYAHDNKGFLGQGRDAKIIAARIASLERQIKNFAEQLKKCEEENGG